MLNPAKRFARQLRRSRFALYTFLPLAAMASAGVLETIQPALRLIYIVLGFSLIIFLHELGHFVVARLCSVKCLAFSIGIGPRMCGYKKGVGFNFGAEPNTVDITKDDAQKMADEQVGVTLKEKTSNLARKEVGDCDYRISWLPLGGYVRMLGQDDMDPTKVSSDPNAFNQRPIWQRMCIVSAGVIMNLIFAAVCFSIIFSPGIGVDFPPAKIGFVTYDSPAWKAGLRPGDEIVSINHMPYRGFLEFTDIQMECALSSGSEKIHFEVRHPGAQQTEGYDILPTRSAESGFLAIGVAAMPGLKMIKPAPYSSEELEILKRTHSNVERNMAELAKLDQKEYRIVKIDDTDVRDPQETNDKYMTLTQVVQAKNGKPVTLTLESTKTPGTTTLELYPYLDPISGAEVPPVFGLVPQVVFLKIEAKSAAAQASPTGDKLQAGDRVLRIGERSSPDVSQFKKVIKNSGPAPLTVTVERQVATSAAAAATPSAGQAAAPPAPATKTISITLTPRKDKDGNYILGVQLQPDLQVTRFVPASDIEQTSSASLPQTATIVALNDQPVANWQDIYAYVRTRNAGDQVKVLFDDQGTKMDRTYTLTADEVAAAKEHLQYLLGLSLENETKTQVAANAGQAILMGMDHTKKFVLNVYMTLAGLFRGTVDASNLHGIVGITKVGYDVQERGPVWLWYVLAMVSVNLAVANFLPLPIVDGGLFLLLILEKVRGKPLSLKIQSIIQTVGIVLLASLFLFVTMNDIKLF